MLPLKKSPIDERAFSTSSDETLPCLSESNAIDNIPGSQTDVLDDSEHDSELDARSVDLTGRVQKTDPHAFFHSREADFFKGQWLRDDAVTVIVAIKAARPTVSTSESQALSTEVQRQLNREGKIWASLTHPNIAPFFGICYDLSSLGTPCFIMPYYRNGDVNAYLSQNPKANRLQLLCQVAAGIEYLHGHEVPIVHGNIKTGNILINDNNEACLTHFGFFRTLECTSFRATGRGFLRWMAPELFDNESPNYDPHPTLGTDVWAFAMCALQILTRRLPYCLVKNDVSVVLSISRGVLPQHVDYPEISDEIWQILQTCWAVDPADRPPMRQLSTQLNGILSEWSNASGRNASRDGARTFLSMPQTILRSLNARSQSVYRLIRPNRLRTMSLPARPIECSKTHPAE